MLDRLTGKVGNKFELSPEENSEAVKSILKGVKSKFEETKVLDYPELEYVVDLFLKGELSKSEFGEYLNEFPESQDMIGGILLDKDDEKFFENVNLFFKFSTGVAVRLLDIGKDDFVIENLERFEGLVLDTEMVIRLCENLKFMYRAEWHAFIDKLLIGDKDLAVFLMNKDEYYLLSIHLGRFEGLDKEVAMELIKKGYGHAVIENLERFEGLVLNRELLEAYIGYMPSISRFDPSVLGRFEELDKEIAVFLIKNSHYEWFIMNGLL